MGSGLLQLFVGDDRLSSTLSATHCGGLQSGLYALDNEITLKLGKRTEQMEDQCAAGSGCVHAFDQRSEANFVVSENCHCFHQMFHGPAQAVKFPYHKRVATAQKGQGIIQAGAVGFDTGDDIFKHGLATRIFECINLRIQLLVCCWA